MQREWRRRARPSPRPPSDHRRRPGQRLSALCRQFILGDAHRCAEVPPAQRLESARSGFPASAARHGLSPLVKMFDEAGHDDGKANRSKEDYHHGHECLRVHGGPVEWAASPDTPRLAVLSALMGSESTRPSAAHECEGAGREGCVPRIIAAGQSDVHADLLSGDAH